MQFKRSFVSILIALVTIFTVTTSVSADEFELFDIDYSTDKTSYEYDDEVTSTITIKNESNRYSANNVKIETDLPEDFELVNQDEDIVIENGKVIWNIDQLERGDTLELTYQTKLKQSVIDAMKNGDKDEAKEVTKEKENDEQDSSETDKNDSAAVSKSKDKLTPPQTGDDKSILKYVIILVLSIAVGIFAFITIRKKRIPKSASFLLAITMLLPTISVAHAENSATNFYTSTDNYQFTIGDRTYDISTTVTAELQDHYEVIPVTGTVTDANGNILANTSLTFTATVFDEEVEEVIETDDEGYFVTRLAKGATYTVENDRLKAKVKANDTNEIDVTNETGKIELGKKLTNGDNHTKLQPSVIYLSDEDAAKFNGISSDLSNATINGIIDIQQDDLIVIPEIEGYPEGISFLVESVEVNNGQMILHLAEPELEAIFSEIVGDLSADLTAENFTPAENVTFVEEEGPSLFSSFSTFSGVSTQAVSLQDKITLSINNIYKPDDNFAISGTVEISGRVSGDIDWRVGLNPVESMDFNFRGEQKVTATMTVKAEKKFNPIELGKFRVPTKIPGVTVNVPLELVSSVGGNVNYSVTAGMRQNIGLAYERGSGMRTYPEEKFTPYLQSNDVNGTGYANVGLKLSGVGQALGWEIVGLNVSGGLKGSATTSILGQGGVFNCVTAALTFERTLGLEAPIFKWKAEMDLGRPIPLWSDTLMGDCVNEIQINPDAIELEPEQTKSVIITASNHQNRAEINDSDKLKFTISEPNKVKVVQHPTRVDIKATDQAMDGDVIKVKVEYDQNGEKISDELTVKIVDNRPKGELVGNVSDAVSGAPLHKATVKIFKENELVTEVKTNEDGSYKANLAPGNYKVEVSYPEYITDTSRVKISSIETTTYDAKLELVGNEYGGIGTVKGKITNAVNGAGIEGVTIEIRRGKNNTDGEVIDTVTTDRNGNYEVKLNGGNYTILLSKEGYITTHANILAIGGQTKTNQNATMSPDGVIDENLRIVLTWGADPRDLDSHFTGPKADGGRFHVYYSNKRYQDAMNDVNLDRDDVTSYGPETVTVINRIQEGTYTYAVHNYTGRRFNENNQFDLSNSNAKVEIYRANTLLATYHVPLNKAGNSWRVFEIRDGEIVPINRIETIDNWRTPDSFAPISN